MRYELKSIPIWPLIKIAFFVNLVAGFLLGLLYVPMLGVVMQVIGQSPLFGGQSLPAESIPYGVLVIFVPIVFAFFTAFFWTVFEVVIALFYNLFTKLVGGLELNLEPVAEPAPPQPVSRPMYAETSGPIHGPISAPPPPPPPPSPAPSSTTEPHTAPPSTPAGDKRWPSPLQPPDSDNSQTN